ncbi:hypothetical protein EJ04DRAFT_466857 [Polyplosphaeria fusca]|uniref:Transmembrane protein n=1 Tax=Polyplosphaeria fusca TaxID=682080 RepID=A0A9P4QVA3_9PLEO|nr:hypothetical protein EJ04DRAFT_466857 [Polyplosphaeria fusca]
MDKIPSRIYGVHGSRFTVHGSRFTVHGSRFTILGFWLLASGFYGFLRHLQKLRHVGYIFFSALFTTARLSCLMSMGLSLHRVMVCGWFRTRCHGFTNSWLGGLDLTLLSSHKGARRFIWEYETGATKLSLGLLLLTVYIHAKRVLGNHLFFQ